MKLLFFLAVALLWAPTFPSAQTTNNAQERSRHTTWHWLVRCGGPTMVFEVRFDNRPIRREAVPLCRTALGQGTDRSNNRRIDFTFRPKRAITWVGYRDASDRTPAGAVLEMNFWEAGAEADSILIGASVLTRDRILMNAIHVAHPDRGDDTTIARGLVVRTYPMADLKGTAKPQQ